MIILLTCWPEHIIYSASTGYSAELETAYFLAPFLTIWLRKGEGGYPGNLFQVVHLDWANTS